MSELTREAYFSDRSFPVGDDGLSVHHGAKNLEDVRGVILKNERRNEHIDRCKHPKGKRRTMFDYL